MSEPTHPAWNSFSPTRAGQLPAHPATYVRALVLPNGEDVLYDDSSALQHASETRSHLMVVSNEARAPLEALRHVAARICRVELLQHQSHLPLLVLHSQCHQTSTTVIWVGVDVRSQGHRLQPWSRRPESTCGIQHQQRLSHDYLAPDKKHVCRQ